MVFPVAAAIGAAASVASTVLGNNANKKAAAQARANALKDQEEQFVRLRKAAEKGGFNPLTALQSGTGISTLPSGVAAPLATNEAIRGVANAVSAVATQNSKEKLAADDRQAVQDEIARYELLELQQGGAGNVTLNTTVQNMSASPVQTTKPKLTNRKDVEPFDDQIRRGMLDGYQGPELPTFTDYAPVPVFDSRTGDLIQMNGRIARHRKLEPYDVWTAGDGEEYYSEPVSEADSIVKWPAALNTHPHLMMPAVQGNPEWVRQKKLREAGEKLKRQKDDEWRNSAHNPDYVGDGP